ncbi:hypothetical protein JAAARDRAFT_187396 [Jaapia argillacea MUCL 33604]|uniref:Uncharacterized protein n=1 Tax=Jaapia argillacea MUCL 33604 TaxID=933084 RepID=A0A067QN14_9AGAM|nr:hypothetical protein JAAARDRAFT_187396 [Jaapia argillacea MUCL 33604]
MNGYPYHPPDGYYYHPPPPGQYQLPQEHTICRPVSVPPQQQPEASPASSHPSGPTTYSSTPPVAGKVVEPALSGAHPPAPVSASMGQESISTSRKPFSAADLVQLARVANDMNVYSSKRGEVTVTWNKMADKLRELGLQHSTAVFRNKLESLLQWHDDEAKCPMAIRECLKGSAGITISALINQLASDKKKYKDKTDKEKLNWIEREVRPFATPLFGQFKPATGPPPHPPVVTARMSKHKGTLRDANAAATTTAVQSSNTTARQVDDSTSKHSTVKPVTTNATTVVPADENTDP